MQKTPKGFRLHIGLFGRRNVGKSSLLNAMTRQNVSIVSELAGTTTDPVEKPMELLPFGPILFIDTAGLDDLGSLGELRIKKTRQVFDRTDLGIIVTEADTWGEFETKLFETLAERHIPIIVVLNKVDVCKVSSQVSAKLAALSKVVTYQKQLEVVEFSNQHQSGILDLRQAILNSAPSDFFNQRSIVRDLLGERELAVLVIPIDKEAPKGRLILPEVQAIRDILDGNAYCIIAKDTELTDALNSLKHPPKLVITDSSCFDSADAQTPKDIPLTSFSILFSRFKGDLLSQARDTLMIGKLKPGDRVLVSEACAHHPIEEDIGRVKIPRLMNQYIGGELQFDFVQGHDMPDDLTDYSLVIMCGSCMLNRREVLNRVIFCGDQMVPCSNYGLVIAYCLGIFERVLAPFPDILNQIL